MTDSSTSAAPSKSASFRVFHEEKRVMLSVAPASGSIPRPTLEEVLVACKAAGFEKVDAARIAEAIEHPVAAPVPIGDYEPRAAGCEVTIAPDGMQAWVRLTAPDPGGRLMSIDELKTRMRLEGIIFGVKDDVIAGLAKEPVYGRDVLVAEGRPVADGADSEIEYHFETQRKLRLQGEDEHGRVDFKELNLIENVVEGQLLATLHRATAGTPGITVKNEYVPPKPGRDRPMLAGKNVALSPDGLEAHATCSGAAMLVAGKPTVSQIYSVTGSVGANTGNISFLGTVQISDSVEDGFTVKATDAVLVGKTVGKAVVEAGGDVTVRGGVIEAAITCGGDLRAKFIQESKIDVRNDAIVTEAVLHSHVECGGRLIVGVGGKKGTIVGGQIRAFTLVACRNMGSPMSTKTLIDVGINPKLLARMEELQGAIIKDRGNYYNIRKGLAALDALREKIGQLPADKQRIYDTLVVAQTSLKAKLQEIAAELRDLQAEASVKHQALVSVSEDLYPGVKISIGSCVHYSTQVEKFVTYKEEGGEIRMHTYEAPKLGSPGRKKAAPGAEALPQGSAGDSATRGGIAPSDPGAAS
jgi:uncharacterized protein